MPVSFSRTFLPTPAVAVHAVVVVVLLVVVAVNFPATFANT